MNINPLPYNEFNKVSISQEFPDKIASAIKLSEQKYPFHGFGIPGKTEAASLKIFNSISKTQMTLNRNVTVKGIGSIANCYTWKKVPSIQAEIPKEIQNAAVRLPSLMTMKEFEDMRKMAQQAVTTRKGLNAEEANILGQKLGGIVIEATLPYQAKNLLQDNGADVNIHCIFQTGLNFAGMAGGGIPVNGMSVQEIENYYSLNAQAALGSALNNDSDVLVFNIGIGTGFFGGAFGPIVKQANVDGICLSLLKTNGDKKIKVLVPEIGFSLTQRKQLEDAGVSIAKADKDSLAALLARDGLRVSETIAADPMSILGIHGPGLWWETAGSASDEERAAFLSPCYAIGHIPINIYETGKTPQKIAALSEFMLLNK